MKKFTSLLMIAGLVFFGNMHAMLKPGGVNEKVFFDLKTDAEKVANMTGQVKNLILIIGIKKFSSVSQMTEDETRNYLLDKDLLLNLYNQTYPAYFNLTQTLIGGAVIGVASAYAAYVYFNKKSDQDTQDKN